MKAVQGACVPTFPNVVCILLKSHLAFDGRLAAQLIASSILV